MTRRRWLSILGWTLTCTSALPIELVFLIGGDTLFGDATFLLELRYGSRRRLLMTLLTNLRDAAPTLVLLGMAAVLVSLPVRRRKGTAAGLLAAGLAGALVGLLVGHGLFVVALTFALTALLVAALARLLGVGGAAGTGVSAAVGAALVAGGVFLAPAPVGAEERVILIGGGYRPSSSQVQIELNVRWLEEMLLQQKPAARLSVYYGAGEQLAGKDVVEHLLVPSSTVSEPLARVFGALSKNGARYFHSRVERLSGGTEKTQLLTRLKTDLAGLGPGDRLLFIFNGHGGVSPSNTAHNTLRLWDETELTALELAELLPASTPTRLFLPECYSGGFQALIRPGVCAFFSQDELLEAEGCTPSVDTDNYRDYTSYFFSALWGATRTHKPLAFDPDRNHDGQVTLQEAHFYALVASDSADLPRSSSEAFVELRQPWYLRWTPSGHAPEGSIYTALATELGRRLEVASPEAGRRALALAQAERERISAERERLHREIEQLQKPIKAALEERWPAVLTPYSESFWDFARRDLAEASRFAAAHPGYPPLAAAQDQDQRLEGDALVALRRARSLARYLRLLHLARLFEAFERTASREDRATLAALVACESTPL
jgi:hypothetical protein